MAQTERTAFIPFAGGLDLDSNPHTMKPGMFTKAAGVNLNKSGYAYPGPGYSATAIPGPTNNAAVEVNFGVAAYTYTDKRPDAILAWNAGASANATLAADPAAVRSGLNSTVLMPWRQRVNALSPGPGVTYFATSQFETMTEPPRVVGQPGGLCAYLWRTTSGYIYGLFSINGNVIGPYYLDASGKWNANGVFGQSLPGPILGKWGAIGWQNGTLVIGYITTGTGVVTLITTGYGSGFGAVATISGHAFDFDCVGPENPANLSDNGLFVWFNGNTNSMDAVYVPSTGGQFFTQVSGVLSPLQSGWPIACNTCRDSSGNQVFNFAGFHTAAGGASIVYIISSNTITGFTGGTTGILTISQLATQMSICASDSTNQVALAVEVLPAGSGGTWSPVTGGPTTAPCAIACITQASSTNATWIYGWGGMALLGKIKQWTWQSTTTDPATGLSGSITDYVFPVRSGWQGTTGNWATASTAGASPAYPSGYLYNINAQLLGKFADANVGTDSMWVAFNSVSYAATSLPVLPYCVFTTLVNGAAGLQFAFPQYQSIQTTSVRAADSGAVIGARASPATVTWEAPSSAEPIAPAVQMGTALTFPGLLTSVYDGVNLVEAGFLHRSPTPIVAAIAGGSLPASTTYYYQTVLWYQDASGRVHEGAPSRIVSVATAASTNFQFSISVPYCGQTLRTGTNPVLIKIYRSQGNPGSLQNSSQIAMYEVASINLVNRYSLVTQAPSTRLPVVTDVFTAPVTDNTPDSTLAAYSTLYTTGMSLGASTGLNAPPPFDCLTLWNGRLWGVANRNGPELWFTYQLDQAILQPEAPAWAQANRIPLPAEIGQPQAIVGLDDKLIVLGTKADYGITGDGPSRVTTQVEAAGTTAGFSSPILLPTPGGIRILNGATRLPTGILFQGAQGFTLLDRSLTYQGIGQPVNPYTDLSGNLYLPGIFNTNTQSVLLYSVLGAQYNLEFFYNLGLWSQCEHPGVNASTNASVIVGSARSAVANATYVLPATGGNYYRVTQYATYMTFTTPWIEMGQSGTVYTPGQSIAGYGLLRELQLVGDPGSGGFTTTMTVEYDYANNTVQPPETTTLTTAGIDGQWRWGFANGNCRRARFTITIDAGKHGTASAPPVYLAGFMLSYAIDDGLSRLGSGNST